MGSVRGPISMPRDEGVLCFGSFKLDPVTRILRDGKGGDVTLRRSEYALLSALLTHAGRVLSRDQLRDAVSGRSAEAFDRSIDFLIGRLCRKLGEDSRSPELIKAVSGRLQVRRKRPPHDASGRALRRRRCLPDS